MHGDKNYWHRLTHTRPARRSHAVVWRRLDPRFRRRAGRYVIQSAIAGACLFLILVFEQGVAGAAVTASIASSVFIAFVVPHSVAASTRRVLGGQILGLAVGSLASFGLLTLVGPVEAVGLILLSTVASVSVGLSIVLMALTETQHPPAAATCLGIVLFGASFQAALFVITAVLTLVALRLLLLRHIKNLL